jgi:hypothetical protein
VLTLLVCLFPFHLHRLPQTGALTLALNHQPKHIDRGHLTFISTSLFSTTLVYNRHQNTTMKAQPSSSLTNNRSSFLPKKRASPSSSDSGFSEGPECAAKQQQGTSLAGVTFPRRPPLRRTTPKHILSSDHVHRSSTEAIAFERELQNLLEVEYRDDVQEYMYEMEVRWRVDVSGARLILWPPRCAQRPRSS